MACESREGELAPVMKRSDSSDTPAYIARMAPTLHSGRGRMKRYFELILIAGCLAGAMHLSAEDEVSITVRPAVAPENGDARLKVFVARNAMNRALMWEIDGTNYYRSSTMQLDGASSPSSYVFLVRNLPAGEFEIRALVRRADNTTAIDRGSLHVVGARE